MVKEKLAKQRNPDENLITFFISRTAGAKKQ